MAALIYLAPAANWQRVFAIISDISSSQIYLATQVFTHEIIEKVPNDQINFPEIPPHIMKENNQREDLLVNLSKLANTIEEKHPNRTIIPTLVGSDWPDLLTQLKQSDLAINEIKKIT